MKFKARGLQGLLQKVLPLLRTATRGQWLPVHDGVEVLLPIDMELSLSGDEQGRVHVTVPNGIQLRVDPARLAGLPCHTPMSGHFLGAALDDSGADVSLQGFLFHSVRLEAAP